MPSAAEIDDLVTQWSGLPVWTVRRKFLPWMSPEQIHAVGGADELVGVGFFGLFQAAKLYDPGRLSPKTGLPATFQTFAIMCIRHAINGHVKKNLRHVAVSLDGMEPSRRQAIEPAAHEEPDISIWECVRRLNQRQVRVITLRFRAGFSLEEIGQQLGISHQRVQQIHEQALRALEAMLTVS
jgi:RNA polymerase sigma factor (sigma-70 family)